jgi:hypothetical protein
MYNEYTFLIPPNYEQFDDLSKAYEQNLKRTMGEGRARVLGGKQTVPQISAALYRSFISQ